MMKTFSHMFRTSDHIPANFLPIDATVELVINEPAYCNVVSSHQVESMADLEAGLGIVCRSNNSLDGLAKDDVRDLVARE